MPLEHLSVFSFRFLIPFFCPSPDILRQRPTGRCAEHSQQSSRGFFDIVSVAGDYAAGAVVDAIHNKPLVAVRGLHFHLSPKGKALRIVQILPQHGVGGAVRLIFYVAYNFIQDRHFIFLIDQPIFV